MCSWSMAGIVIRAYRLGNASWVESAKGTTDAAGFYDLGGLAAGNYRLMGRLVRPFPLCASSSQVAELNA